jgi:hypothetical protein
MGLLSMNAAPVYPARRQGHTRPTEKGAVHAAVAATLLARPDLGIRRYTVVGLQDRDVVHFAAAARALGLHPAMARGDNGHLVITLTAPARDAAEIEHRMRPLRESAPGAGFGGWLRGRLEALGHLVGRRTS